jgi:hypothetical protein
MITVREPSQCRVDKPIRLPGAGFVIISNEEARI